MNLNGIYTAYCNNYDGIVGMPRSMFFSRRTTADLPHFGSFKQYLWGMKRIIEKPDYRSMDEARLKHELVGLERRILGITGDPLGYRHYRRFLDWSRNEAKVKEIEELMLDRCIILNLLFDCHCTPAEVERLEKVNDLLLEMTNRTYHRTADLVRALLVMKKDDMDDDYMIESRLIPVFDIPYSVLRLDGDCYYGSDFIRMAAILQETEKNKPGMADVFCNWSLLKGKSPSATDAELECSNDMDDGTTWAEGPLRDPRLEHIVVCHALHALCTHMNWSIPDVLRINDFSIEVKLTIQQFSDQERNRLGWCDNYDLRHFKEVLLKEAADRPEGVSPENALLQRCRDYFEDIADEVLDRVGILL